MDQMRFDHLGLNRVKGIFELLRTACQNALSRQCASRRNDCLLQSGPPVTFEPITPCYFLEIDKKTRL